MKSIARKFFTDLSDFDSEHITLDNYRKINEAEKLYNMFGQNLFNYLSTLEDIKNIPDKNSLTQILPHKYSMAEVNAIHSLSACWYVFTDDSFTSGFAFPGSNDQIRRILSDIPGLVILSTNGLNLLQSLKNSSKIPICYCKTLDEVLCALQNSTV